jgi:hypothetical protein
MNNRKRWLQTSEMKMMCNASLEKRLRVLFTWYMHNIGTWENLYTCSLNEKLQSDMIPKSTTLDTETNSWLKNGIRMSSTASVFHGSCFLPKAINSVFLGWLVAQNMQLATCCRSSECCVIELLKSLVGKDIYQFLSSCSSAQHWWGP